MSAKHTSWPWQVKNELDDTIVVGNVDGESFSDGTYNFHFEFVCDTSVDDYGEPTDPDTAKANARLIAAAPELLEVVRDLVSDGKGHVNPGFYDLAVKALAKAEGRS